MTRNILYLVLFILFLLSSGFALESSDDPIDQSRFAWDEGNYIEALQIMKKLMNGPNSDHYFEEIALLTGELYQVDTLATDGQNPVFSPDNKHFSFEVQTKTGVITHIRQVIDSGFRNVHSLVGYDFIFSPDGRHGVFMRTDETGEMQELQRQLNAAFEARDRSEVLRIRNKLQWLDATNTNLYQINFDSGEISDFDTGSLLIQNYRFDQNGNLWFSGFNPAQPNRSDIYMIRNGETQPQSITDQAGYHNNPTPVPGYQKIVYTKHAASPFPSLPEDHSRSYDIEQQVILHDLESGETTEWAGESPVVSANGEQLTFHVSDSDQNRLLAVSLTEMSAEPNTLVSTPDQLQHPTLSPDGSKAAYMIRNGISWNIHMADINTGTIERLTNDIQHELFPHFLDDHRLLAMMGESRHRRAHIYDIDTKDFHRVFHNNIIRTVSLEYEWESSADANHLLVVAERDGDTISPARGVYLVRLDQKITEDQLRQRIQSNLKDEKELRYNAEEIYKPIHEGVQEATQNVNLTRLYEYQKSLYDFGSKHMTQPGNRKAGEYIYKTLESFGYEPEYQWFEPAEGIETANVIARLEGTKHPEVVYILSSHYDSVQRSPGADDNSSGTAVLLETARVLKDNPLPATIIFASLTAEESGLLGARDFVRVVEETGLDAAGVINNDMMGWTRHHRLDNTIRFSNRGIRDVQHSGAILFTDLITYDSRYYRFTDAHVFFDAYGDVIGGIGSYPILGNPNYHQTTDRLETINHRLVREVAKSTTATLMNLASSPSKVRNISVDQQIDNRVSLSWDRSPETDIDHYVIRYQHADGSMRFAKTDKLNIQLDGVKIGSDISVAAVNDRGMQSWDWSEINTAN